MDAMLGAASAASDEAWRKAVTDSLHELVLATQRLHEQNAVAASQFAETSRRIDKLEERSEKAGENAARIERAGWQRQVDIDWKVMAIAASILGNLAQVLSGHIILHW